MAPPRPRVALALGGGGGLGWAHIGVIRALRAGGIDVAACAGTSAGAMVAAFLAAGRLDELEHLVRGLGRLGVARYFDPSLSFGSLVGGRIVRRELARRLGADTRIEAFAMPMAAVAADLLAGDEVRLTTGPVVPAVMASIAIPGVFRVETIGGRHLVDGGMVANLPIAATRAIAGDLPIVAVDLFADYPARAAALMPRGRPRHAGATARAAFAMLMRAQGAMAARIDPPAVLVAPAIGPWSSTDFHEADALIAAGHAAGVHALPAIRRVCAAQ